MSGLRRVLLAVVLTALLVSVASAAMYVTSAPKLVSLLVEPFSLLLMPGLVAAVVLAGPHDFTPGSVILIASVFYSGVFWWLLPRIGKAVQFARSGSR